MRNIFNYLVHISEKKSQKGDAFVKTVSLRRKEQEILTLYCKTIRLSFEIHEKSQGIALDFFLFY